jgi:hypothetical protein
MRTNRALRATAILIFGWIGLRASFLLTAPSVDDTAQYGGVRKSSIAVSEALPTSQPLSFTPISRHEYLYGEFDKDRSGFHAPLTSYNSQMPPTNTPAAFIAHVITPMSSAPPDLLPFLKLSETHAKEASVPMRHRQFLDPNVSVWAIIRPTSSMPALATNGQLGASQAGVRVQQPLLRYGTNQSVALNVRLSTPLDQKGAEAGVGLAVRPTGDVPVELTIERRIAIERGARDAMALIVAGGFDDTNLNKDFSLSGYAQGGIVGFSRKDAFIDGALRVERSLLDRGHNVFRIGFGVWGAAQPQVSRLDVGPIAVFKQKVSSANIRISAEYRWRISGEARPVSGPALSIGADF